LEERLKMDKNDEIVFTVFGQPSSQARARYFRRGNFSGMYDPSKKDKNTFAIIVQKYAPKQPITEAISLEVIFYMLRPKSHYGTGKNSSQLKKTAPQNHSSKPDIDNLTKFVIDAMNTIFFKDDSLISQLNVKKIYSDIPRTEVKIKKL